MENLIKWRFPKAGYATKTGINRTGIEEFKKAPLKSLAREIIQNSLDAHQDENSDSPVMVDFNKFDVNKKDIPGIEDLETEIDNCLDTWKNDENTVKKFKRIKDTLNNEKITCLRISDFNTTGLLGVDTASQENNLFLALTKGTGISKKKKGVTGGSKGIGKYASFACSELLTVFYSTLTNDGKKGYMGVANLVSSNIEKNNENTDWTQGTGFYSKGEMLSSIDEPFMLDKAYTRNKPGTDVYIIGFKEERDWMNDIIIPILDSFIVSIYSGKLVLNINDICINKNNLKETIDKFCKSAKDYKNIMSMYRIISNCNNDVIVKDIDVANFGTLKLMVLMLNNEKDLATHKCTMIRYPYMKIKQISLSSNINCSAICLIPNNELGKILLSVENPRHDNWEYNRIEDPVERDEIKKSMEAATYDIQDFIAQCANTSNIVEVDPGGAGDFLPGEEAGDNTPGSTDEEESESVDIRVTVVKPYDKDPNKEDPESKGSSPDIGNVEDGDSGEVIIPGGHNGGGGGGPHDGPNTGGKKPGDNEILSLKPLSSTRYRVILVNKEKGEYRIIFNYDRAVKECYATLSVFDDSSRRTNIEIQNMVANGNNIVCSNPTLYGPFDVLNGKNMINVKTNLKEVYSFEVKIYANKQ